MNFQAELVGTGNRQHRQRGLIHFAEGLIGFPECRNFQLLDNDKLRPFRILYCTDVRHVGFVVIDPRCVISGYNKRIPASEWRAIGLRVPEDRLAFVVAVLGRNVKDSTANFSAPLIVNRRKMIGKQIVLDDSTFSVCAPLFGASGEGWQ